MNGEKREQQTLGTVMQHLVVQLDADDSWLCRHVDSNGQLATPTRLRLDQSREWSPGHLTLIPRRCMHCPDCGTYWRVWMRSYSPSSLSKVARPSADWISAERAESPPRYRRAPVLDIERVMDLVRVELPAISVMQHESSLPWDDEGVWWFWLPDTDNDIQLESSKGMCPFFVEHSGMKTTAEGWWASTVEDAALAVTNYLLDRHCLARPSPFNPPCAAVH